MKKITFNALLNHKAHNYRQEVEETPDENFEAAVSDCEDFEETEEICMTM